MRRRFLLFSVLGAGLLALVAGLLETLRGRRRAPGPAPRERQVFDRAPLRASLAAAGHRLGDAVHIRIFKLERRLEVWLAAGAGFEKFRDYPICTFSGTLGPKLREGDRQAPEGFYRVARAQLNPNSRHHLAFNLGFPNAYDRAHGRTGSALMVHGGCSSVGCYAMTDPAVDEIYAMVEAALDRGQDEVDVHVFPFELTVAALAARRDAQWHDFWANLKEGADLFAAENRPPRVAALDGLYRFGADADMPGARPIRGWQS